MINRCVVCGSQNSDLVHSGQSQVLTLVRADNNTPRQFHELRLVACRDCGHLFNSSYTADLPEKLYGDVPLTGVPVDPSMQKRIHDLLVWLGLDSLSGSTVLEIGAGSGQFARLMSAFAREVVLYEPCTKVDKTMLPEANIALITSVFPGRVGDERSYDFVFCRQVLEHIADPDDFLAAVAAVMKPDGKLYIEIPDRAYITRYGAFPDLHLHHPHYYGRGGLTSLAARHGFRPLRILDIKDGHDFGILFGRNDTRIELADEPYDAKAFSEALTAKIGAAQRRLAGTTGEIALYGATSHGQAFLNFLDGAGRVSCVLDDNPANRGYSLYDCIQTVPMESPNSERLASIGTVVITAYIHDEVIAARLRRIGFSGEILTARPAPVSDNEFGLSSLY